MIRNLYAFTESPSREPRVDYPGYVSLNVGDDGVVRLSVRTPNAPFGLSSCIPLDLEQQAKLGMALLDPNGTKPVRIGALQGCKAFAARVVSRWKALQHAAARWLAGEEA